VKYPLFNHRIDVLLGLVLISYLFHFCDLWIVRTPFPQFFILQRTRMTRLFEIALLVWLVSSSSQVVTSLTVSDAARVARGRLFETLASPSGKLTLSPEIIIPEPTDPTSILLQSSAITSLSGMLRVQAKANSVWISGSVTALQTFCSEQQQARGNFPGPVPVVYCTSIAVEELESVAIAGASGILIRVADGNEISSLEEITSDATWVESCKSAWQYGLQPIPEVTIGDATAASWKEDDITTLVAKLSEALSGEEPVSVLLTVKAVVDTTTEAKEGEEPQPEVSLPRVPKALGRRVPILGSIRTSSATIVEETARFKEAGFTGAVFRSECVPGYWLNPDLNAVAKYWSSVIGSLKSTRSKSFDFRSKNQLQKNVPYEWMKYQKDVIESGALGSAEENMPPQNIDSSKGDYVGF
jgi:hypothetical protein